MFMESQTQSCPTPSCLTPGTWLTVLWGERAELRKKPARGEIGHGRTCCLQFCARGHKANWFFTVSQHQGVVRKSKHYMVETWAEAEWNEFANGRQVQCTLAHPVVLIQVGDCRKCMGCFSWINPWWALFYALQCKTSINKFYYYFLFLFLFFG